MISAGAVDNACWACGGAASPDPELGRTPYLRCARCGFCFQSDRVAADLRSLYDDAYFDDVAGGGDYAEQPRQRRYEAKVRVRLLKRHAPSGRVLEVGAANGHFLDEIARNGYDSLGIEPVASFADEARCRYGVDIRTGFIEDVELPDGHFHAACAWHVLEHMVRPTGQLTRIRDALRPGGYLFVEVPNIESFIAQREGASWGALEPRHHVGHYGPRSLRTMLETAGFEVIRTETIPFFTYLRPAAAIRPRELLSRVWLSRVARVPLWGPHASKHELLRGIARVRS